MLTAERRAELEANLAEARAAYHRAITGQAVASIGRDGRNVAYGQFVSDRDRLLKYIEDLEVQLGLRKPRRLQSVIFR